MRKLSLISIFMLIVSIPTFAGGLLTNTNQHILFLRMLARDASTQIDAVYSNPAGTAFMQDGFYVSLNGQSAAQTRTIHSTFGNEKFPGFAGFGGNQTKMYKGEASAPFVPSAFAVYKKDKWAFSANFAVTGGGGKATFNEGLGSFESQVAMIPGLLAKAGIPTNQYSVNSYMEGKQYIFGLQLGAAYRINDYLSVFGGARVNYVSNAYYGYLKDIKVNPNMPALGLDGSMVSAQDVFNKLGKPEYAAMAADIELDCEQSGWGITPIIGADFKKGKWNVGVKYEFLTNLNIENKTKGTLPGAPANPKDDKFANYRHGVNTPQDVPSLLTVGVSYEILPVLRASVGYHHFFDTHAEMATVQDPSTGELIGKQNFIGNGTNEYLAGLEWDVCKWAQVSAGMQRTKYGVKDNFQTDMSFSLSSYSFGLGAGFDVAKNLKLNVAYFWTNYDNYEKVSANYNGTGIAGTDVFSRTNKVFGIGLDYKF